LSLEKWHEQQANPAEIAALVRESLLTGLNTAKVDVDEYGGVRSIGDNTV